MPTRPKLAYDMDTALIDEQWEKLSGFLKPKLSDPDMGVVENICRNGGDAPEPKAGRDPDGASDRALRKPSTRKAPAAVAYDAGTFPHSGRLKR